MNTNLLPVLLIFYGIFLICCGITSVVLIGSRAKTALMSGGTSGAVSLFLAYLASRQNEFAPGAGMLLAGGLLIVFCWRSAKTLFKIFELIPAGSPDLKGKGIAFLIISLMAVVSIVVLLLQILLF